MSSQLRTFLLEAYASNGYVYPKKLKKDAAIQIDDQDDSDDITQFCNIFVTVGSGNRFEVELTGQLPVTREMADLADIYHGTADRKAGRITLQLNPRQIEALNDLATYIKRSALVCDSTGNPGSVTDSARCISSLYRFVRIINEYVAMRQAQLS